MTFQALIPALVIPLVGYRLYRRFRSHVGPQPVRRTRLAIRVGFFALLGALLLAVASSSPGNLAGAAAGLAVGAAVGLAGLRLTRFAPGGQEYTPDLRIGAAVTSLLAARVLYRVVLVPPDVQAAISPGASPAAPIALLQQNPLTIAVLMLVVGYYVVYSAGVLRAARRRATG